MYVRSARAYYVLERTTYSSVLRTTTPRVRTTYSSVLHTTTPQGVFAFDYCIKEKMTLTLEF